MDPFTMMAVAGAGTSIVSGIMGADSAKKGAKAQEAAFRQGQAAFNAQADRGEGFVNTGADAALGYVQPYAEGGRGALDMYLNAIGVNGNQAQQGYYDTFQDDPGFKAALDAGANQVEHSAIFQGRGDSGAAMKELYGYGERMRLDAYNSRLDRLSGLSQLGLQAGTTAGGIEQGRGNTLADIALKRGGAERETEMAIGTARAGGIAGANKAWTGALQGLGSSATVATGSIDGGKALSTLYGTKSGNKLYN